MALLDFVQFHTNRDTTGSNVNTFSSAVTNGSVIVVDILFETYYDDVTSLTDNKGNTYIRASHQQNGSVCALATYYCLNAVGGSSFAITLANNLGSAFPTVTTIHEYLGDASVKFLADFCAAGGAGVGVQLNNASPAIVHGFGQSATAQPGAGSGFTIREQFHSVQYHSTEDQAVSGSQTSVTFTSGGYDTAVGVSFGVGPKISTLYIDPGGDADNFFSAVNNGADIAQDTSVKVQGIGSYRFDSTAGNVAANAACYNVPAPMGLAWDYRLNFWFRYDSQPTGRTTILLVSSLGGGRQFELVVNPSGAGVTVGLDGASHVTTSDGATVLSVNTWYRISVAVVVHSINNQETYLFINGTQELHVTSIYTGDRVPSYFFFGWAETPGASKKCWFDQLYVDDGGYQFTDVGDVRSTAKLPTAVNANNFDTVIGTGAVNERPANASNGMQQAGSSQVSQNYNLETIGSGDIDISNHQIYGYMGWAAANRAAATGTPKFTVNGIDYSTALPAVADPSWGITQPVSSASYPTAAAAIGLVSTGTTDDTILYECGIVIAYNPVATPSPIRRGVFGGLLLALSSLLVPGSWVNAATRFKIYGTTWASAATRFIVQVIGFKDAATRFKLFGITFRDANTRFILWVRNYVDAATRFILQVRGYKDASTRFKMYGITWANAATRFVLNVRSYKDAATRFKLWVQGYRDASTRFILQVRNYADASTRFVLTSANTTWKNANTRFILWVRGFRDANTRFKVVVQAYRDAATRFKLTVQSFKDAATRFKLIVQAYRDASTRFILTVRAYKDAATRFVLTSRSYKDANTRLKLYGITYRDAAARFVLIVQGTSFKDAATRFKLSGITWKNASTRFKVTVLTFRDAGSRFIVIARAFRDASSRFKVTVQAYRDASSRFKVTVRAYRDAGTRFITIARNFADGKTRFKVSVRSFRDGSTRFKVATLLQYRNSFTRFISVGGNSRNVNCRFALITVPPGYRKAVVDPEYRITTVPPQLRFPIVDKEGRPS